MPSDLVEAARAGHLVVFVGAGASMDPPASLPNFMDLVKDVGARASYPPSRTDLERLDKFLGALSDRDVDVHGLVARAIDLPDSRPNRLHDAIVGLARTHPPIRIVTTNYDRHLTSAALAAGLDIEVFRGPALPVGDDFVGLVHLHGSLDQDPGRLVVTDTDFGHAYIREAWAARFLDRMFSAFTVLFIGYSYGDLVMQYLGRSLGPGRARFVLTDREDLPEWKSYGLTPVVYQAPHGSHVALSETLERWAELASLGRTEHRRLIGDIVSIGPPVGSDSDDPDSSEEPLPPERALTPEERSYLEEGLGDPERVKYFAEKARGSDWLSWVATRPEFSRLFAHTEQTDERTTSITNVISRWIADHYPTVETESPTALRIMRSRQWSQATLAVITHRLFAQDGVMPTWQTPWFLLTLQQTPPDRNDLLDMLLAKEVWRERPDLALLLFEHRTRPILTPGIDWGEASTPPGVDIDLVGEEHWLTSAWTMVFVPILDEHVHTIIGIVTGQLHAAHRMLRSLRPGTRTDAISFGRSAIEPHEQNDIRAAMDVLIDAARDCLQRLLDVDPPSAAAHLESWAVAEEALFRRLAVHGWRLRGDRDVDQKLQWVREQNLLYDLDTQHEVFILLADCAPDASDAAAQALLEQVLAGPPPDDGEQPSPYRTYNLLAWLARVAPQAIGITDAFNRFQGAHPQYTPRDHPDLTMVLTAGVVEDAEPFAADQLHGKIEHDPGAALGEIRNFQSVDEFRLTGPTWSGAVDSVRGCVTRYPADGLVLAGLLEDDDRELRTALIDAWAAAELDAEQIAAVIAAIDSWNIHEVRGHAARMLANGGRDGRPTAWHQYPSARDLATKLWPLEQVAGNISANDDRVMEAINHPAGDLAQFWTKVVEIEWQQHRDAWSGLPTDLRTQLDVLVQAEGRNGLLARTILGSNLRFHFAADPEWTRTQLLVLFNWDHAPAQAAAVWQGFLLRGRPDDGLLEAGLLDLYLQCCQHTDELGRERSRAQLADHLVLVAMFASPRPDTWLPAFVTKASEELREAWADRVASRLSDLTVEESSQQWLRWIDQYWTGRTQSVPLPLTVAEASKMARWVLGLPNERTEAIGLVKQSPAGFFPHGSIPARLTKEDLAADTVTWTNFITHLLRKTPEPTWDLHHYLPQIVKDLKKAHPPPDLATLIDEAMRLGYNDASEW